MTTLGPNDSVGHIKIHHERRGAQRFQSRQLQGLAKPSYRRHKGLSKPIQAGRVSAKPNMRGEIVTKSNQKGEGQIKPKLTCDIPANNPCSQAGEEMLTNTKETGKDRQIQSNWERPHQTQQTGKGLAKPNQKGKVLAKSNKTGKGQAKPNHTEKGQAKPN